MYYPYGKFNSGRQTVDLNSKSSFLSFWPNKI